MYFRFIFAASLLLLSCTSPSQKEKSENLSGSVAISGAFALYPMAVEWTNAFSARYPSVRIDLSAGGAGKGMTDVLNGMVDFAMLSREPHEEETQRGALAFAVAKDAVVPVVSAAHPLLPEIRAHGITAEDAAHIWIKGDYTTWGDLLGTDSQLPLHVYTRSDACGAAQTFAAWFHAVQEDLGGIAVYGDPGIAKAVSDDPFAIGFNNMAYAYDSQSLAVQTGLSILPIDINADGRITADEDFYKTRSSLAAAIEAGRFPSPPSRNLYLVSNGTPVDSTAIAFLRFVLKDGQRYNEPNGYIRISHAEARASLRQISATSGGRSLRKNNTSLATLITGTVCLLFFLLLGIPSFIPSLTRRRLLRQRLSEVILFLLSASSLLMLAAMLTGLWSKAAPILENNTLGELLSGTEWKPSQEKFGFLPFIHGTLSVTLFAILFSLPVSLLTAIFMTEYAPGAIRRILHPALDILASLPSVIFGVWGILTLIPLFGYSLLTASIVLSVMIIPIQVSLFSEIMASVPVSMRDASYALGATRWQTTRRVVLRRSLPGIFAAVVLALSKCVGETIAVMMVCGCLPSLKGSLLDPFHTLPALIGNNYGEMASVPLYESAIMFAALLLLLMVVLFNLLSRIILYRIEKSAS